MTYRDDDSDLLPEPGPTASDVEGLDKLKPCDPKSPLAKEIAQAFDEYYDLNTRTDDEGSISS